MNKIDLSTELSIDTNDLTAVKNDWVAMGKITSEEKNLKANEYLSIFRKLRKEKEKQLTDFLKPTKDYVKHIESQAKPIIKHCKVLEDEINAEIIRWVKLKMKKEEEAKAKIEAELEAGKISEEKAVLKLEKKQVKTSVTTQTGNNKVRFIDVLKITDKELIPKEYLVIDEAKVKEALKSGVEVPGAKLEKEPINVVR